MYINDFFSKNNDIVTGSNPLFSLENLLSNFYILPTHMTSIFISFTFNLIREQY